MIARHDADRQSFKLDVDSMRHIAEIADAQILACRKCKIRPELIRQRLAPDVYHCRNCGVMSDPEIAIRLATERRTARFLDDFYDQLSVDDFKRELVDYRSDDTPELPIQVLVFLSAECNGPN